MDRDGGFVGGALSFEATAVGLGGGAVALPGGVAPLIAAHELTHAVDDQYFDLDAQLESAGDNDDLSFAIIDGKPFQHAPEWTLNFEIDYRRPLASGNEIYFFTDWKFKGETNDFLYENIEYTYDNQFEGGLRFGYRNLERNYEIGFFGRNITDEDNPLGGIDFANTTGYVNQPRIYGLEASYNF